MTERSDMDSITALRLQLLANGWAPIPNRDKRTFFAGWPGVVIDEAEIQSWGRRHRRDRATGLRVEDFAVIDWDINHPVINVIVNRVLDEVPELADETKPLLVRLGKGLKEAWFVRSDVLFSRLHTRRWVAPGESADAETHSVECFGGASPRQFGAFGPHTRLDDGTVAVEYRWVDRSPADTRKPELIQLPKAVLARILDIAEEEFAKAGFTPVLRSTAGESDAVRAYDLVETMTFDLADGRTLALRDLHKVAQEEEHLRCSASFLEGPTARNTQRCLIGTTRDGRLTVWESSTGVTHMEATLAPRDLSAELNRVHARLMEAKAEADAKVRNRLRSGDSAFVAAAKAIETYAFCPNQNKGVVPIWATGIDEGMLLSSFRTMLLPYAEEEVGPRGGRKVLHPVDIWAGSDKRRTVQGLRLRPDRERPVYSDAQGDWVNVYAPPLHDAVGGSPDVGIEFLEHLVPDEAERRWHTQWLAHKLRFPHIPGPAVIMVARQFGTGRGTYGVLVGKLFGPRYVRTMPFTMVAGSSYQSQYTDWGASTLVAIVNESSDTGSPSGSMFAAKRNTYEHLKELVEPRPAEKQFVSKQAHFTAMSFTSYLIFTNHVDAIPIPEDDRRFAVLSNGEKGTPEFWVRVNAWMEDEANVAAFAQWLGTVDLTGYSPYLAPAMTRAKSDMVEASRTDIDRGMTVVMANLAGEAFVPDQVIAGMRQAASLYGLDYPEKWPAIAKRELVSRCYRVGVKNGQNWHPLIDGKRHSVYVRSSALVRKWTDAAADDLRDEVLKSGSPAATGLPGNVLNGLFKGA